MAIDNATDKHARKAYLLAAGDAKCKIHDDPGTFLLIKADILTGRYLPTGGAAGAIRRRAFSQS
jgi:hypothetical protein